MGRPQMIIPIDAETTRHHLVSNHGYPNSTYNENVLSDWQVLVNHVWEHENADRHSDPSHAH